MYSMKGYFFACFFTCSNKNKKMLMAIIRKWRMRLHKSQIKSRRVKTVKSETQFQPWYISCFFMLLHDRHENISFNCHNLFRRCQTWSVRWNKQALWPLDLFNCVSLNGNYNKSYYTSTVSLDVHILYIRPFYSWIVGWAITWKQKMKIKTIRNHKTKTTNI